jgi:RNA polymerase sigma-70 factor (ECF subfamily)
MPGTAASPATDDAPPDDHLVARTLAGDRGAFNLLVRRHERRLFRFLCKSAQTAADAEDAMQQALVKSYVHLARYDARWRFTTWLFSIALRELRTIHRRSAARPAAAALDNHAEPAARPDPAPDLGDGPGEIWQTARRVLKDVQYTALWLRYGEDLQAREIAKVMGRPRVWVSVTLHRACAALRQLADHEARPHMQSIDRSNRNQTVGGTF